MKRVLLIIGTRPEAIKMAPVVRALRHRSQRFNVIVCVTGQHRQMLDQTLAPLGIVPDYDLDIMQPGQGLGEVTARALSGLSPVLRECRPDAILVQGDTTTALCGALAGYYERIAVGHVEAGLRTGDKFAPFPEEMNRALIARLSDYHFAPTERAYAALVNEGIAADRVFITGNTIVDSLLWMRDVVRHAPPPLPGDLKSCLNGSDMVLITGHRRESFGEGFENICHAIRDLADRFDHAVFVYPVHLNPNVREPVQRIIANHPRIHLIEPLAYPAFVWLLDHASLVLTDSGGIQEEAPSLGKPVLVMRHNTERQEALDAGGAVLVGSCRREIVRAASELLADPAVLGRMKPRTQPFGDGQAGSRIVDILERELQA